MDTTPELEDKNPKKKDKDKVRSAWISFAGRIIAQLVGAIATVSLGVMVLHRYTEPGPKPLQSAPLAVTVIFVSAPSTQSAGGAEVPAPPTEIAARQAAMARAIAQAVSGTPPRE